MHVIIIPGDKINNKKYSLNYSFRLTFKSLHKLFNEKLYNNNDYERIIYINMTLTFKKS